jgi:hypothetical protein
MVHLLIELGYNFLLENGYVDLIQTQPVETWCPADRLDFQLCVNSGMNK